MTTIFMLLLLLFTYIAQCRCLSLYVLHAADQLVAAAFAAVVVVFAVVVIVVPVVAFGQ